MASKRRILVTGGVGFIGHNVVRKLQEQGNEVVVTDTCTNYGVIPQKEIDFLIHERRKRIDINTKIYQVDICDPVGIECLFRSYQFDTVIHLASFPRQKVVNTNPMTGSRTMSEGLLNLLECSTRYGVDKFVYISSSMVYGDFKDDVREDAECRPQGQYGIMKLAGEWLVRDYTRRTGMAHVIIRPSAVYGPYDVEDRVVSKFLMAARRNSPIKVNGETESLDFTFVEDTAEGIVAAALNHSANNNIYNITRGKSHSLLTAGNLVVKIVGRGNIEIKDRDQNFPSRGSLNIDAARRDLGYDPKIDLEEGLWIYHEWIRNNEFYKK